MTFVSHIFQASFVQNVASFLTEGELSVLAQVALPCGNTTTDRVGAFLDILYAKAPSEFLRRKDPSAISAAIKGCLAVLSAMATAPERIAFELQQSGTSTSLFLALDDHPFIISSIVERLYEAHIHLDCYQHPIVSINSTAVAISYIEISPRCADDVASVIPNIREALESLKQIVADHQGMISSIMSFDFSSQKSIRTEWGELSTSEGRAFLNWLASGSFFFIGVSNGGSSPDTIHGQGIWQRKGDYRDSLSKETCEDLRAICESNIDLSIHKLRTNSIVHRRAPLLHIIIKGAHATQPAIAILGYLTSKARACEAMDIPILRHKLQQVLSLEETPPNSHDYKYTIEVIDNMPTDEALVMSVSDLRTITQLALGVFSREDSRSATFIDGHKRSALTVVVLPPERLSAEIQRELQSLIESRLRAIAGSSDIHLDSTKKRQLRLYVSTPLPVGAAPIEDLDGLGRAVQAATLSWRELLEQQVELQTPELRAVALDFPDDYKAAIRIPEAINDYALTATLTTTNPLGVSLFADTDSPRNTLTFISITSSLSISKAVPVLQNIGLEVLDANSYTLTVESGKAHVLKCEVQAYDNEPLRPEAFNATVSPALVSIVRGVALDDPLNLLVRKIPISIEQISLLRCYCAFLWQTHKIATKRTMWKSLASAPEVALHMVRWFDIAFNPASGLNLESRRSACLSEEQALQQALRRVPDITHDRILRGLIALMKNTVRTNFYTGGDTIAIKVASQRVDFMPHPRPLFEIFVFSSRVEGTHLRSSKVARGGIRWSERIDDYRSEVLGLMKTQKVKNVIIVPSGAKGGFIVKDLPSSSEAIPAIVEAGYREYIRALLSLADNQLDGSVISPTQCVIYDEPDPYFVVAADKGTATFSDIANSIAQNEFQFWLGDAFASGGSVGYDHKKYGITAKGGWECVLRHCKDIGLDTSKQFTAVGIGDMSGDVFGNAMILTESMSLIAAFNHRHIFIDPQPCNAKAFKERLRLFTVPRSQWSDFDPSIISAGGGVFSRYDKEILLTPETRKALMIPENTPSAIDGETLISYILKAPVDLLWNGGIGTYVKARSESNSDVNDGANDNVRINADELQARIVGEGGNLGFTQKARIEFALRGGRINTDAIDNSGGVDLSDHEVNLKLLVSPLIAKNVMTLETRNELLREIAGEVVESVLRHNQDQSLTLSISANRSATTIDEYRHLIRDMHRLGFLDRNRDSLPDEQELDLRMVDKSGLTRPELAVCSAAVKMWIKEGLRGSSVCADPSLQHFLLNYFPKRVQIELRSQVVEHPLRNQIIANELVGDIIPAVGISFVPSLVASHAASIPTVIKSVIAADTILGARALRERLRLVDRAGNWDTFSSLWFDMSVALQRATSWLLYYHGSSLSLDEMVTLYRDRFAILQDHARLVFTGAELTRFENRVERYEQRGISHEDAILLSLFRRVIMVLEILWCAREYKQDVKNVAQIVSESLDTLQINILFKIENSLQSNNKWEQELIGGSFQEIRRSISVIAGNLLKRRQTDGTETGRSLATSGFTDSIISTMGEVEENMRLKRPFQVSVLPVVARQLRLLTEDLSRSAAE